MGWQMFVDAPVHVGIFRGSNFGLAYVDSTLRRFTYHTMECKKLLKLRVLRD